MYSVVMMPALLSVGVVDWNGDGADDFVVSHIHSPAALMTNANATGNGSAGFRFVSTSGARDAEYRTSEEYRATTHEVSHALHEAIHAGGGTH